MREQAAGDPPRMAPSRGGLFATAASGVGRLTTVFVNLYVVDLPGGGWVLVDTGLPGFAWYVRQAIEGRYGAGARPDAIVLTHGHFDHAGSAGELARAWGVPVYAHRLELPYLTGRSDYPPQDPTSGGAICFLSRFFPRNGIDLGGLVRPLPEDGTVPPLPGWRWLHTPGHTSGHVSLFREADRVLLAGDAVATTDLDSWASQLAWPRELSRPPTPFTPDWESTRASLRKLADLAPRTIAAGHGLSIDGENLGVALRELADGLEEPMGGRYTHKPVRYADDGSVAEIPPPVADPLPRNLALGAAAAVVVIGLAALLRSHGTTRGPSTLRRLR